MNFFIKEYKRPTKWNALDEVIEYEATYAICRTSIWLWFAKLFPKNNIEFLYVKYWEFYNDSSKVLVEWHLLTIDEITPKTIFKDKESAEETLKDIQTNPDKYFSW